MTERYLKPMACNFQICQILFGHLNYHRLLFEQAMRNTIQRDIFIASSPQYSKRKREKFVKAGRRLSVVQIVWVAYYNKASGPGFEQTMGPPLAPWVINAIIG